MWSENHGKLRTNQKHDSGFAVFPTSRGPAEKTTMDLQCLPQAENQPGARQWICIFSHRQRNCREYDNGLQVSVQLAYGWRTVSIRVAYAGRTVSVRLAYGERTVGVR